MFADKAPKIDKPHVLRKLDLEGEQASKLDPGNRQNQRTVVQQIGPLTPLPEVLVNYSSFSP